MHDIEAEKELRNIKIAVIIYIVIMFIMSSMILVSFINILSRNYGIDSHLILDAITKLSEYDNINILASRAVTYTHIVTYTLLLILIFYFMRIFLISDFIKFKGNLKNNIKFIAMIFLGFMIITMTINVVVNLLTTTQTSANQYAISSIVLQRPMAAFFIIVICAPIVEELIFRKSVFNLFNDKVAFVISTFLFGIIHMLGEDSGFVNTILLSLTYFVPAALLSFIYLKSNKNIIPVIIIHMLNNLVAFILIFA